MKILNRILLYKVQVKKDHWWRMYLKRINQNVKNQNTIRVKRIKLKRINQNVIEEILINSNFFINDNI